MKISIKDQIATMSLSSLYIVQFLIKYKELIDDRAKQETNELVAYNSTTPNHQFFAMSLKGSHELLWIQFFYRHLTKYKIQHIKHWSINGS